jgi:DNA-binding MarR family transcriptional regulator
MESEGRQNQGAERPAHPELTEDDYRDQADFRCALRHFLHLSEEQAQTAGITPQQHLLLIVVRGHRSHPRVTVTELAEALHLRQSSVSLLVDRMVKKGLLHRQEDPTDRRRAMVSPTDEGQRVLDAITLADKGALEGALFRESLTRALQHYKAQMGTTPSVPDQS